MERTTARERLAEEAVMFPVDVSRVSEESGREALEALPRTVVGRRRVGVEEGRGWAAESECNRGAPLFATANATFKKCGVDGYPPEEARGCGGVETEQLRTRGG
jgi:hypothetical protein